MSPTKAILTTVAVALFGAGVYTIFRDSAGPVAPVPDPVVTAPAPDAPVDGVDLGLRIAIAGEANGTVVIDLFEDVAPAHSAQIAALARDGLYDGVVFHRVIDGFMAQTGDVEFGKSDAEGFDMRRAGMGGSALPDVAAEFSDIAFDRGVVGMARSNDPDSANSQFFIMFEPGPFLNNNYTVVGKVTEGMEIVDAIKRGDDRANGAVLGEPDRMVTVTVTE